MNWNRDITKPLLWVLFVASVACIAMFTYLARSNPGHGRDARKAEGEQLMGSARDICRIAYAKTNDVRMAQAALEAERENLVGEYYRIEPGLNVLPNGWVRIYAQPVNSGNPTGHMDFDWQSGNSAIHWE